MIADAGGPLSVGAMAGHQAQANKERAERVQRTLASGGTPAEWREAHNWLNKNDPAQAAKLKAVMRGDSVDPDKLAAAAAMADSLCNRLDAMERDAACDRVARRADTNPGLEAAAQDLREARRAHDKEQSTATARELKAAEARYEEMKKPAKRADAAPGDTNPYNKEAVSKAIASAYRGQKLPSAKGQRVTHALLKGWRGDSAKADAAGPVARKMPDGRWGAYMWADMPTLLAIKSTKAEAEAEIRAYQERMKQPSKLNIRMPLKD